METLTEKFIEKAKIIHGSKYDYSFVEYVNAKTKVTIICKVHGAFEQTPDKHVNGRCGCPVCAGNVAYDTKGFVKRAKAVHGDKYDYSSTKYVNNRTPVDIICSIHGVFSQIPGNHLSGNGCPFCANNQISNTNSFVSKAKQIHGDRYDYSEVCYSGNKVPVKIICSKHGGFEQRPDSHLMGSGCPVCGRESQVEHRDVSAIRVKVAETCLRRYGVANPMFNANIRAKQRAAVGSEDAKCKSVSTKRQNGSFNTSLPEYRLGLILKSIFGEADVLNNYVSDVYPFRCDYYIPFRDLYIELNAHWSHGGHWYTEMDTDIIVDWFKKSNFFRNAAVTFSVRDVEKRETARLHNLNYIVFWKSDLSDVHEWIDAGCPDGHDWLKEYSWLS